MLQITDHGRIRELRLHRPPANALDPSLLDALAAEIASAPDVGVGAVVVSGSPGLFSGGLDVPHLLTLDQSTFRDALGSFFGLMEQLAASRVPVAAAITGHSPAGGAVISLFCDWRVMAAGKHVIGFNEVKIGIPMPTVVIGAIARAVGPRRAEELCVSGRLLGPDEACRIGLVDEVAPTDEVVGRAVAWCDGVVTSPAVSLGRTRERARADLRELVARCRESDVVALADAWFLPEVQKPLRELMAKLGKA